MTAEDAPVPDWVFGLLDAWLEGTGWSIGNDVPLEVIRRIQVHESQRETVTKRIAEIRARRTASTPEDIDWLAAELEERLNR